MSVTHWHHFQISEFEVQEQEFIDALGSSELIPLCVVAWSRRLDDVIVAMADDGWDELTPNQETIVFNKFGTMALDFAPLMTEIEEP
jgi:hypothetical protein